MSGVKSARQQRRAAARSGRGRTFPAWIIVLILFAIAGLVVAGGFALADRRGRARTVPEGVETFPVGERFHVQGPVSYPQTPPVGGSHAQVWQNCGFYDAPVPNETAVHSLEHGAVWITYQPDLPETQVDVLRRLARSQTFVLVTPFPGLPAPVVASAWGVQIRLNSADTDRLTAFMRAYRVGPQTPEPGAPCSGGVGDPK